MEKAIIELCKIMHDEKIIEIIKPKNFKKE